jgi:hypothetical protein
MAFCAEDYLKLVACHGCRGMDRDGNKAPVGHPRKKVQLPCQQPPPSLISAGTGWKITGIKISEKALRVSRPLCIVHDAAAAVVHAAMPVGPSPLANANLKYLNRIESRALPARFKYLSFVGGAVRLKFLRERRLNSRLPTNGYATYWKPTKSSFRFVGLMALLLGAPILLTSAPTGAGGVCKQAIKFCSKIA